MMSLSRALRNGGRFLGVLLAGWLLAACGSDDEFEYVERPPEELYNSAYSQLLENNYEQAANLFDEVERQHPYSIWAPRAQLMSAFAHYQNNQYDDAINTLDRFIQLNPGSREVSYAYYLKAVSYYEQISDVQRDQKMTQEALVALEEVVRRFPETTYARDAELKIDLARDHLAGKHMNIGRYYQRQGEYLAAINRFQLVVRDYQTTTHTPEALLRLVECNLALGITDEARANAAVLGYNFPGSNWYEDAYNMLIAANVSPTADGSAPTAGSWNSAF